MNTQEQAILMGLSKVANNGISSNSMDRISNARKRPEPPPLTKADRTELDRQQAIYELSKYKPGFRRDFMRLGRNIGRLPQKPISRSEVVDYT